MAESSEPKKGKAGLTRQQKSRLTMLGNKESFKKLLESPGFKKKFMEDARKDLRLVEPHEPFNHVLKSGIATCDTEEYFKNIPVEDLPCGMVPYVWEIL